MGYRLTARSRRGGTAATDLTPQEGQSTHAAKALILFAIDLEERFSMIRENYREYEREVFEIAQEEVLYDGDKWSERIDDISSLNRRLFNLLSSARLYRDQWSRQATVMFGPASDVVHRVRIAREAEETGCLAFEFMESVRNTMQHVMLPLNESGRMVEVDDRQDGQRLIRHTATPSISLLGLVEAKEIDRRMYDKLAPHSKDGNALEVNGFVRDYLQALARIHEAAQGAVEADLAGATTTYRRAIARGMALTPETFLVTLERDDGGAGVAPRHKSVTLFEELLTRLERFRIRCRRAAMMPSSKNYVSTE